MYADRTRRLTSLEGLVGAVPSGEEFEVDGMGVEFRSVDTRKPRRSANAHAAATAQAGSVDHQGVEACDRRNGFEPRQVGDGQHHRDGTDDEDPSNVLLGEDLAQNVGDQAGSPGGAILSCDVDGRARADHVVEENEPVGRSRPDDTDHTIADRTQCPRHGKGDRRPDAAGDDGTHPVVPDSARLPERTKQVCEVVAEREVGDVSRRASDHLDDERERPVLAIGFADGEWDPLAGDVGAHDDELTGKCGPSDPRRIDHDTNNVEPDRVRRNDGKT